MINYIKGPTCYEIGIGRLSVRILRPCMYFWPYRHFLRPYPLVTPRVIKITWEAKPE